MSFASGGLFLLFVHPQSGAAPYRMTAVALNPLFQVEACTEAGFLMPRVLQCMRCEVVEAAQLQAQIPPQEQVGRNHYRTE